jgi:hypothetical protein
LQINPLLLTMKVVDEKGYPLQPLQIFSELVAKLSPLVGTGSPENVIEAKQTQLYMDKTGAPGAVLYIKQVDAVGTDRKKGWVLV